MFDGVSTCEARSFVVRVKNNTSLLDEKQIGAGRKCESTQRMDKRIHFSFILLFPT